MFSECTKFFIVFTKYFEIHPFRYCCRIFLWLVRDILVNYNSNSLSNDVYSQFLSFDGNLRCFFHFHRSLKTIVFLSLSKQIICNTAFSNLLVLILSNQVCSLFSIIALDKLSKNISFCALRGFETAFQVPQIQLRKSKCKQSHTVLPTLAIYGKCGYFRGEVGHKNFAKMASYFSPLKH